jgi:hypothetical protein
MRAAAEYFTKPSHGEPCDPRKHAVTLTGFRCFGKAPAAPQSVSGLAPSETASFSASFSAY